MQPFNRNHVWDQCWDTCWSEVSEQVQIQVLGKARDDIRYYFWGELEFIDAGPVDAKVEDRCRQHVIDLLEQYIESI